MGVERFCRMIGWLSLSCLIPLLQELYHFVVAAVVVVVAAVDIVVDTVVGNVVVAVEVVDTVAFERGIWSEEVCGWWLE